jgi:hypothetical protein
MRLELFNKKKQLVLDYVSKLEDGDELDKLLRIISSELDENNVFGLNEHHLEIVNQRRELHFKNQNKSFTLEEVLLNSSKSQKES